MGGLAEIDAALSQSLEDNMGKIGKQKAPSLRLPGVLPRQKKNKYEVLGL
jgi:hypothetical protein